MNEENRLCLINNLFENKTNNCQKYEINGNYCDIYNDCMDLDDYNYDIVDIDYDEYCEDSNNDEDSDNDEYN